MSQEKDLSPTFQPVRLLTSPGWRQFIPSMCCFGRFFDRFDSFIQKLIDRCNGQSINEKET